MEDLNKDLYLDKNTCIYRSLLEIEILGSDKYQRPVIQLQMNTLKREHAKMQCQVQHTPVRVLHKL